MSNFKVYKKAIAVLTAGTLVLFSGCTAKTNNSEANTKPDTKGCIHLTVYFEDKPITFKECDGYEIYIETNYQNSRLYYEIEKDSKLILDGVTLNYNAVAIDHDVVDKNFYNEVLKKSR